jgi:hypothetical protein
MKISVAESSIRTYHQIGHITSDMQRQIMDLFEMDTSGTPWTRREIAQFLQVETSCIAGHVNELIKADQLVETGMIRCPVSGRMVGALSLPMIEGA